MDEEYTKAQIAEINARAQMYTAIANLLDTVRVGYEAIGPSAAKLVAAAVEEAITKGK